PVGRRSTTISADSSTMRPASAAPSISEGASNHAVATPSTTRQFVPISVMPGTVEPIPDDLLPDSDHVPAGHWPRPRCPSGFVLGFCVRRAWRLGHSSQCGPARGEERVMAQDLNAAPRFRRKDYERELFRLQSELTVMQEWVKQSGARVVVVFEGRD